MSTGAAQASDVSTTEAISTSLDQITDFDNLFETFEVGKGQESEAAPQARDEAGKFAKPGDDKAADDAETKPDAKTADSKAKDADEAAAEDDEDYIEIPGEGENAQPSRLKLADVLQGYQERDQLRSELETLSQRTATLPADVEAKLVEATQARQQYAAGLEQLQQWMQPRWPSRDLINPNSPAYDPAAYNSQLQAAETVAEMQAQIKTERERVAKEAAEVDRTVLESRQRREWTEAVKAWPELKDQAVRTELTSWLKKEGYSDQEIDRIDSRDLKIIKRAFAHDKAQATKETVAKVVLAKPRVVRPQARTAVQTGRQASATEALSRLGKSGSVEDARAALEALL